MARTLGLLVSCLLFLVCSGAPGKRSRERVYYVGIIEDSWDYAPSGKNLLNGKDVENDEHASVFLVNGPHRIGSVYKKAMFRQFTDATYSQQAPRPSWLGFLGPILRAEIDDVITVHLKNFATRNYSMHPHGVFYEKNAEGALYPDGTSGKLKKDDSVPPGGSYTYRWEVRPEFAPTDDDANCLTWVYHSHVNAPRDIASGLIGALLTCKKGILKDTSERVQTESAVESVRNDVDQDVFLMFNVVDENLSWYLLDNIQKCSDPAGVDRKDPDFHESNLMHAINGYMFGNLPGIELCQHRAVAWHLFGMGNEVDIHSAFFHGNTLLDRGHRTDVLSLFPATFVTAQMVPKSRGKWLLACQVNDHLQAGMQAFYDVKSCGNDTSTTGPGGIVRNYYLAAEKVEWNYAPTGRDVINNISLTDSDDSEVFFGREDGRIGGRYMKVLYKEYTDSTFTTKKTPTPDSGHLGLLGPVLRAEEGDTLRVTFMNMAERNYSIQPHGVHYDKRFQGSSYEDGVDKPGSHVGPGETFTYTWQVLEGPSSSDSPCINYLYYSATDAVKDTNSGLVGPLLVCKKGTLGENGMQKGVNKEFFLLFSVMDENLSWYLEENIKKFGSNISDQENEDFVESNMMHAVNGFMYGNLPGLEMCAGDKVRWYTFGLGTEVDIHGVYFEGNTFKKMNTTRDTLNLFPHTTTTVAMEPNTHGLYEVSCRVTDHYSAGMRQQYKVNSCPGHKLNHILTKPTKIVQYFISAEEIEWDFSPSRDWEKENNHGTLENSPGNDFVEKGENRIGSRYKKVVYREYTDDSFSVQKKRQENQQHLGIMGPIIKAEVGEQIVITFKNKANRTYSINAHGVTAGSAHIPAQPGQIIELAWNVPESSGPGVSDPNCISYAYYSSVDFIKDLYSGLVGPLVVCRPGTLQGEGSDRRRNDVEKEFALLFMVHDENQSWYLDDNIKTYLSVDPCNVTRDEDFEESNMMHGINGRLYGNLLGLEMTQGQKVDWYLLGMGNEVDMHTVHFHAETFTYKTDRVLRADVFDLFPGTFQTVEMVAGNPGTWFLHCHVTDHIHAGMETTFTIKETSSHAPGPEGSIKTLLLLLTLGLMATGWLH